MTPCERFETKILALHLNELDPLTSWRVRRHVRCCPACATRLAAEGALDGSLLRTALVRRPTTIETPSARRTAIRVGGLTMAVSACIGGAILLRPGTPGGPSLAFAEVEKALSDSKYITWTQTTVSGFPNAKTRSTANRNRRRTTSKELYWASILPLRLTIKSSYEGANGRNVQVFYDARHLEGKTGENDYYWENDSSSGISSGSRIKNLVLAPIDSQSPKFKASGWKSTATPWKAVPGTLNGKVVTLFSRTEQWEWEPDNTSRTRQERIWVDPTNHHLLRRESHTRFSHGLEIDAVAENFQYLNAAPTGAFDPPRPKTGEYFSFVSFSGPERKLLVEDKSVDQSIRQQIGQIVDAMNAGNAERLATLGDAKLYASDGPEIVGGKNRLQREAYLRNYMREIAKNRAIQKWQLGKVPVRFTAVLARWHRHSKGAAYPPTQPMDVTVKVPGTAYLRGVQKVRIEAFFNFRLTPSGPKLTWFNPNLHP